jgi:hypothetical protein
MKIDPVQRHEIVMRKIPSGAGEPLPQNADGEDTYQKGDAKPEITL